LNKKRWLVVTLGLVLILAVAALVGCGNRVTAQGTVSTVQANQQLAGTASTVQVSQQAQGIWVSGTGEVSITPDIATLSLGVEAQEANVAQALAETSAGMAKVMQSLTDAGIAAKDIQTGYFSINQQYRWDNEKQINTPIGYQVNNMVTVKIRDIGKVGNIIDAVVQAAGDLIRINGINFSVENPAQYYQNARNKAMAAAKGKADDLAKLAGVTLGGPTYIAENAQYTPYYGGYANYAVSVPAPAMESASSSISAGETKITLSVQVAYSIVQ
jgi:uncharacterized protein